MSTASPETIVLGGGCFWCLEAVFDRVEGVLDVESGYSNGQAAQPSYEAVCGGRTGCAEVVKLVYDPARVTLERLLDIFFTIHDPTTPNRQGNDVGTQYRSGIYYATDAQRVQAQAALIAQQDHWNERLVTELEPLAHYWPAEAYHQDYFLNHPEQGYCAFVVRPKVDKFHHHFAGQSRTGAR